VWGRKRKKEMQGEETRKRRVVETPEATEHVFITTGS